ncbi:hypothetical protein K1719_032589 [Acacia pycnantha]|nr:hypothetical protein K1719_032589 [Acacia pycnantha]
MVLGMDTRSGKASISIRNLVVDWMLLQSRCSLSSSYSLQSITIYPIKSCGSFSSESWPLSNHGVKYDQEWILKSLSGEILTLKKVPQIRFISTNIDFSQGMLFLESPHCKERLQIKLDSDMDIGGKENVGLYGTQSITTMKMSMLGLAKPSVDHACCYIILASSNRNLTLNETKDAVTCRDAKSKLNFANEAQFLLVSEESVSDLKNRLGSRTRSTRGSIKEVHKLVHDKRAYVEQTCKSVQVDFNRTLWFLEAGHMMKMDGEALEFETIISDHH